MVTPAVEAAVVAAPHSECALEMVVSIPAFPSMLLSHQDIVKLEARLFGSIVVIKRGLEGSPVFILCLECDHWAEKFICQECWEKNPASGLVWARLFCQLCWLKSHYLGEVTPEVQM